MAKKKSNPNNNTTITTTHSKPHSKGHIDLSPDNQMDNLKTLNHLLLQETMEKRSQIDTLKAQIDTQSIASDLEHEISVLVLSCSVAERERKVGSLRGKFDEMRKVLDGVVGERDLLRSEVEMRRREVGELERENGEIRERLGQAVFERDEMERKGMKREEAYESMVVLMEDVEKEREEVSSKHEEEIEVLMSELDGRDGKIAVLEDEGRRLSEGRKVLELEVKGLNDALELVKGEEEGLRVRVGELEKVNDDARKEIGRMRESIVVLEKEKEEKKVLEVRIGELGSKLDELREKMEEVVKEKDEVEMVMVKQDAYIIELKKGVQEKKVLEVRIGELGSKLDELREKMEEAVKEKDEVEMVMEKQDAYIIELKKAVQEKKVLREKMEEVVKEKGEVEMVMVKQDAYIIELKKEVEKKKVLEVKIAEFVLKLDEMKEKIGEVTRKKDEVEKVRADQEVEILELKKEAEKKKVKLDEMMEKMGEVARENDEVKKVRSRQEVEILELKKEVEKLHSDVLVLEEKHRDSGMKNTQLQDERDGLMRECGEWEKKMVEKEEEFGVKVEEIARMRLSMDDLVAKIGEISAVKDEAEHVKAEQEVEIIELKKKVEKLSYNASELQGLCKTFGEKNTQLENERDAFKTELTLHKKEALGLQLQVEELKKHSDESLEEIKKLNASLKALCSENEGGKRQIETLIEEKGLLEKKMRKAEMVSDKALALLRRTTEALNEPEKAHENGVADHEEIQPFAEALEGIKGVFRSRATTIEEMSREVEGLKEAIEVRNKKRGLMMWLYPATTTVLAAISLAYAWRSC